VSTRIARARRSPLIAAVAIALAAPAAAAAESAPTDFSATDQYVESIPTSGGPKAPGVGKPRRAKHALAPKARARLVQQVGSQDAAQLEEVSTSPELGAPQPAAAAAKGRAHKRSRDRGAAPRAPAVPSAAVSTLGDDDGADLIWLVVALVFITGLAVGAAGYRHYRDAKTGG
jgi:hypothetical protein